MPLQRRVVGWVKVVAEGIVWYGLRRWLWLKILSIVSLSWRLSLGKRMPLLSMLANRRIGDGGDC